MAARATTGTAPAPGPEMTDDERLKKLRERLRTLGDGRDCGSDNDREQWRRATTELQGLISTLQNASDLDKPARLLASVEGQIAVVTREQRATEQALATLPALDTIRDARERDRVADARVQLELKLRKLLDGGLMIADGVLVEPLVSLEERRTELARRVALVEARLDAARRQAQQQLDDA